jgi:hypothetical protein
MKQLIFKDKTGREYLVTQEDTVLKLYEEGHVILVCEEIGKILKLGLKFSHEMPMRDTDKMQ